MCLDHLIGVPAELLIVPIDGDGDVTDSPATHALEDMNVVLAYCPTIQSKGRTWSVKDFSENRTQVVATLNRADFLFHDPFTDEDRYASLALPLCQYGLKKTSGAARFLEFLLYQIASESQIAVRVKDQRSRCFSIEALTEPAPGTIERSTQEAVLECVAVPNLPSVGHRPINKKVVVEAQNSVEGFQEIMHLG